MIGSSIQSPHIYYGGTKGFSADKVDVYKRQDQHHYMEKPSNNGYWDDSLINTYLNLKEREAA